MKNEWLLLSVACLFQGSFGICFKKYKPFSWEAFWALFSIIGILILPHTLAAAEIGDYMKYILSVDIKYLWTGILCGFFWGISAVWYSRAVGLIGVSLVTGINMGFSNILGCFIPMIMSGSFPDTTGLLKLIAGQLIIISGTAVLIKAGNVRRGEQQGQFQTEGEKMTGWKKERRFISGLVLAIASGLGTACLNIGTSAADEPAALAVSAGIGAESASILPWIVILSGGFAANFIYAVICLIKNKSFKDYIVHGCGKAYMKTVLTAFVWFIPLALYGRAKILLGPTEGSAGWVIFNSGALIIANLWGFWDKEWHGSKKAVKFALAGNGIIFAALFLLC